MVNTFIPFKSISKTMKVLDRQRLGKQRLECKQIIEVIENKRTGYKNHPIVCMWKDNVDGLKYYYNKCIDEWVNRGYKNNMEKYEIEYKNKKDIMPWWIYNKQVRMSHQASLLRKNYEYYKDKFPKFDENYMLCGYIWTNNLKPDILIKLRNNETIDNSVICSDIGSGAPSHYRISKELTIKWVENRLVNPKTNRKITVSGNIYKDYHKASKYYKLL